MKTNRSRLAGVVVVLASIANRDNRAESFDWWPLIRSDQAELPSRQVAGKRQKKMAAEMNSRQPLCFCLYLFA